MVSPVISEVTEETHIFGGTSWIACPNAGSSSSSSEKERLNASSCAVIMADDSGREGVKVDAHHVRSANDCSWIHAD